MEENVTVRVLCPKCQQECSAEVREVSEERVMIDYYCNACDKWVVTLEISMDSE